MHYQKAHVSLQYSCQPMPHRLSFHQTCISLQKSQRQWEQMSRAERSSQPLVKVTVCLSPGMGKSLWSMLFSILTLLRLRHTRSVRVRQSGMRRTFLNPNAVLQVNM